MRYHDVEHWSMRRGPCLGRWALRVTHLRVKSRIERPACGSRRRSTGRRQDLATGRKAASWDDGRAIPSVVPGAFSSWRRAFVWIRLPRRAAAVCGDPRT